MKSTRYVNRDRVINKLLQNSSMGCSTSAARFFLRWGEGRQLIIDYCSKHQVKGGNRNDHNQKSSGSTSRGAIRTRHSSSGRVLPHVQGMSLRRQKTTFYFWQCHALASHMVSSLGSSYKSLRTKTSFLITPKRQIAGKVGIPVGAAALGWDQMSATVVVVYHDRSKGEVARRHE